MSFKRVLTDYWLSRDKLKSSDVSAIVSLIDDAVKVMELHGIYQWEPYRANKDIIAVLRVCVAQLFPFTQNGTRDCEKGE